MNAPKTHDLVLLVADAHGTHPLDWRCLRCGLRGSGAGIGRPCTNCNPVVGLSPAVSLANFQPVLVHVNSTIDFSWIDRIRILFGRRAHLQIRGEVLDTFSVIGSDVWVEPIVPRHRYVSVTLTEGEKK